MLWKSACFAILLEKTRKENVIMEKIKRWAVNNMSIRPKENETIVGYLFRQTAVILLLGVFIVLSIIYDLC